MTLSGVPFNTDTLEQLANREGPAAASAAALLRHVQPDGRIYADLDPMGAVTGRYTCREPNLQGLPPSLRSAVEASPGHVLMEADVSQCELRVLAHYCQDPRLLAAYRDGNVDLHVQTAAAALGIATEQVTEQQRNRTGKQVNFAIIFGMTADGLAQKLAIAPFERSGYWTVISLLIRPCRLGSLRSMRRHIEIARFGHYLVVVAGFLGFDISYLVSRPWPSVRP